MRTYSPLEREVKKLPYDGRAFQPHEFFSVFIKFRYAFGDERDDFRSLNAEHERELPGDEVFGHSEKLSVVRLELFIQLFKPVALCSQLEHHADYLRPVSFSHERIKIRRSRLRIIAPFDLRPGGGCGIPPGCLPSRRRGPPEKGGRHNPPGGPSPGR